MHAFFGSVGPINRLMQKLPDDILTFLNNMASSQRGGDGTLKVKKFNFKVRYDFSANKCSSKCNIYLFLCSFLLKTHFLAYFNNPKSFSRSKGQFQG